MTALHYQIEQTQEHKPWLVLLHGLFGSLDNLSMVKRALKQSHHILSIDLPDHGKSAFLNEFSFQRYAQLVLEQLEALAIPTASVLGHSLGGKIAMQMALMQPDKIDRLVVADIAPVAYPPRHDNVLKGLFSVDLQSIGSRNDADNAMSQTIKEAGVRQFLLRSLQKADQGWFWRFNLVGLSRDYNKISGAIIADGQFSKPTLFIKGGNSDYILAEHQAPIASLFPNAKAKIIEGTGHWLHAEKPDAFNRIVGKFLGV